MHFDDEDLYDGMILTTTDIPYSENDILAYTEILLHTTTEYARLYGISFIVVLVLCLVFFMISKFLSWRSTFEKRHALYLVIEKITCIQELNEYETKNNMKPMERNALATELVVWQRDYLNLCSTVSCMSLDMGLVAEVRDDLNKENTKNCVEKKVSDEVIVNVCTLLSTIASSRQAIQTLIEQRQARRNANPSFESTSNNIQLSTLDLQLQQYEEECRLLCSRTYAMVQEGLLTEDYDLLTRGNTSGAALGLHHEHDDDDLKDAFVRIGMKHKVVTSLQCALESELETGLEQAMTFAEDEGWSHVPIYKKVQQALKKIKTHRMANQMDVLEKSLNTRRSNRMQHTLEDDNRTGSTTCTVQVESQELNMEVMIEKFVKLGLDQSEAIKLVASTVANRENVIFSKEADLRMEESRQIEVSLKQLIFEL